MEVSRSQDAFATQRSLDRLIAEERFRAAVLRLSWLAGVDAEELLMPELAALLDHDHDRECLASLQAFRVGPL